MKLGQKTYDVLLGLAALLLAVVVALSFVFGEMTPTAKDALAFALLTAVPFLVFWFMPGSGVARVLAFVAVFLAMDFANFYLFGLSEEMYLGGEGGLWFVIMLGGGAIYWWWHEHEDSS